MGSGYSYCSDYWTTPVLWNHIFKELKTNSKDSATDNISVSDEPASNLEVFLNGDRENSIFELADFDEEDTRYGAAKLVEVQGTLYKGDTNAAKSAAVNPMISFEGDLSYIEPDDDIAEVNLYTFAALDKDGKVIISPADGKPATSAINGSGAGYKVL